MTLIVILICLALEIFLSNLLGYRKYGWFLRYASRIKGLFGDSIYWSGPIGVLAILIPPVLLIGVLDSVFNDTFLGLLGLVFAVFVLAYCLHAIDEYLEASESGDVDKLTGSCEYILGRKDASAHQAREISDAIFIQVNERMFSVLFWFVLLGPLGALLFRLTWVISARADEYDWADAGFENAARHLYGILAWIPARLVAAAYALVGSFEPAVNGWRDCSGPIEEDLVVSNDKLLLCVGSGAMNLEASSESDQEDNDMEVSTVTAARGLALRALLVWVIVIALVTLAGWMS
jgi:membrane protein required for beta-lactamase induction